LKKAGCKILQFLEGIMTKKTTRSTRKTTSNDNIQISNTGKGSAAAAGRNARAIVVNFFGAWQSIALIFGMIVFGASAYYAWQWTHPEKMTGEFRIAVAGFDAIGDSDSADIGKELSLSVYNKINDSLSDLKADYDINIWSPDQVGKISGTTPAERSTSAQEIAQRIDANVVIYGFVDATKPIWQVTPEFYIASKNAFQAEEITGQYQLGEPFTLKGQENAARRLELKTKFSARSQVISKVTIGLLYYSIQDYERALEVYKSAETISGWEDSQGKEVLYLLMGNAASKAYQLDATDQAYQLDAAIGYLDKSLHIDPEYARPFISLDSVYYLQALSPFDKSKVRTDIDQQLLLKAIDTYNQALSADNRPVSSDIETKVHFGLGQCYLMQAYGGVDVDPQLAADEFQYVISDYGNGQNPRVRELAAESHARMGLLYAFSDHSEEASKEYQLAADLLFDTPERQQQYQEKADEYRLKVTATP